MKPPFSIRTWLCEHVGHRFTRKRDFDGFGKPYRVCWCDRLFR